MPDSNTTSSPLLSRRGLLAAGAAVAGAGAIGLTAEAVGKRCRVLGTFISTEGIPGHDPIVTHQESGETLHDLVSRHRAKVEATTGVIL